MKKIFLSLMITVLVFCNEALAQELQKVDEIIVYRQPAALAEEYLTSNGSAQSLGNATDKTQMFSSGNMKVQMTLPAFVDANNITSTQMEEIVNMLDDYAANSYLSILGNAQKDQFIDIANQVRRQYRRAVFQYMYYTQDGQLVVDSGNQVPGAMGPNMAGVSSVYILNDEANSVNLDWLNGKLLYLQSSVGKPTLIYDNALLSGNYNNGNYNSGNMNNGIVGNNSYIGSTENYFGGSNSFNSYTGTASTGGNINAGVSGTVAPMVYQTAPDLNQYGDWEFPAYDNARSAEFKVVEKCWGEDAHVPQQLINMEKSAGAVVLSIGYNVNFTYNFNLGAYYAQDTAEKNNEALYLLTEHNRKLFVDEIFEDVVNRICVTMTDRNGEEYVDENATMTARQEAWDKLDKAVSQIRSYYGKIDVVTENYLPKDVYVYNTYLTDLEHTVFVQDRTGKLFGIKTNKKNDIFQQHDLGGGMTDIIPSLDVGIRQYRFVGGMGVLGNFYLCEGCSSCDECGDLVASGNDTESELMLYFSKYCPEHACRFVWDWLVDPNNNPSREGLKCRERRIDGLDYCYDHKCQICTAGIVGVSVVDATAFADVRDTGAKDRARYSNYCTDHKCMAFSCQQARLGLDMTGTPDANSNVTSPLYCGEHNSRCNVVIDGAGRICNNPVSKAAYEQTLRMICETHLGKLNNVGGNGINNLAPRMGSCAQCGAFTSIYFNGTKCNGCLKANFYSEAQNDLDLQMAIRAAKASAGIDGNGWIDKNSTGLLVNIYDKNGNVLYANVNLATWRAQENGLYYLNQKNGQTYVGYGVNCTDSALNVLARVFEDANASIVMSDERGTNLTLSDEYVIQDAVTGQTYNMATLQANGSCILWDKWESSNERLASSGLKDVWAESASAQEKVNILNSCISYNTNTTARHTNYNTGRDVQFIVDGQNYTGKIFTSYGSGNGVGDNTYAPTQYSLIAKDNQIYRVTFSVDANKKLSVSGCSRYVANIISACDFV